MADTTKPTSAPSAEATRIAELEAQIKALQDAQSQPLEASISQPQVVVQMMNPQPGDPTPGLSEMKNGGEFLIQVLDPDNPGKYKKVKVNALGIDEKGVNHSTNPS